MLPASRRTKDPPGASALGGPVSPAGSSYIHPEGIRDRVQLVAVAGADRNLVAALGPAAAENSGASLGLHAGKKAVGLRAVAAVGLKSTLGHGTIDS